MNLFVAELGATADRNGGTVECFGEGAAILLFFNPARARFESGIPKGV